MDFFFFWATLIKRKGVHASPSSLLCPVTVCQDQQERRVASNDLSPFHSGQQIGSTPDSTSPPHLCVYWSRTGAGVAVDTGAAHIKKNMKEIHCAITFFFFFALSRLYSPSALRPARPSCGSTCRTPSPRGWRRPSACRRRRGWAWPRGRSYAPLSPSSSTSRCPTA